MVTRVPARRQGQLRPRILIRFPFGCNSYRAAAERVELAVPVAGG